MGERADVWEGQVKEKEGDYGQDGIYERVISANNKKVQSNLGYSMYIQD